MRKIFKNIECKILVTLVILSVFGSCKSSKVYKEKERVQGLAILDSLYNQNNYRIDVNTAYPFNTLATTQVANTLFRNTGNTASRIDVQGDGNFIEIKSDSLTGYLVFVGERRLSAGSYGGRDLAIQFDEALENFEKQVNKDKVNLELEFTAEQKGSDNERYNIRLEIYPNKNVIINISPVYRTFMRYDGVLVKPDDEVED